MSKPAPDLEITPLEMVRAIESGEALQIVDVRNPARVAEGRIDLVPLTRFVNIVGSALRRRTDLAGSGIAADVPAVVVCGHGNDSGLVAQHLRTLGLTARSLAGGMAAYMDLVVERPLPPPGSLDALIQFDRIGKGALGYLLASDGEALIVDPPREPSVYLAAAHAAQVRVVGVIDTHVHADYISGAPAIARSLGVPYHLHPADAVYPYDGTPGTLEFAPLAEGDGLRVGRATVMVRHTPGHTEGSVTLLVDDSLALTGDFVFVESLGRPDLAGRSAEWAERLWESVVRAKLTWPAGALVLPAHYASERERREDRVIAAPFGELLHTNAALGVREREAFLRWAGAPSAFPEGYRTIKAINVGLKTVTEREAEELEVGRNECAVGRGAG